MLWILYYFFCAFSPISLWNFNKLKQSTYLSIKKCAIMQTNNFYAFYTQQWWCHQLHLVFMLMPLSRFLHLRTYATQDRPTVWLCKLPPYVKHNIQRDHTDSSATNLHIMPTLPMISGEEESTMADNLLCLFCCEFSFISMFIISCSANKCVWCGLVIYTPVATRWDWS